MRNVDFKIILLSLLAAYMAYLLHWAGFGLMLRPDFVLLATIFWMLRAPQYCNVGTAWLLGLLVDVASGSLFGQNALAYTITAFFALAYQRRLVLFSDWQQTGYVLALLLLNQSVLLVLKLFSGGSLPGWGYFLPSITGILLWQVFVHSRVRASGSH